MTEKDLEVVQQKRGDHNHLGFALQLAYLKYPGWFWNFKQPVPDMVARRLAQQLEVNAEELGTYAIKWSLYL